MKRLLLSQLCVAWYLVGLIWVVQVVHYPLFDRVARAEFAAFEAAHSTRITWIVAPAMLLELALAVATVWLRPGWWAGWVGLALVAGVWASTFLLQVPMHSYLSTGWNPQAHTRLVATNWLRTLLWTGRGTLLAATFWKN